MRNHQIIHLEKIITDLYVYAQMPIHQILNTHYFPNTINVVAEAIHILEKTLDELKSHTHNVEKLTYYSDLFFAQYRTLWDYIQRHKEETITTVIATPTIAPKKESSASSIQKKNDDLSQLPPRERLSHYYGYLRRFNEMLQKEQDLLLDTANDAEKQIIQAKLNALEQRKQRCLDAIDHLESYLAFIETREKNKQVSQSD